MAEGKSALFRAMDNCLRKQNIELLDMDIQNKKKHENLLEMDLHIKCFQSLTKSTDSDRNQLNENKVSDAEIMEDDLTIIDSDTDDSEHNLRLILSSDTDDESSENIINCNNCGIFRFGSEYFMHEPCGKMCLCEDCYDRLIAHEPECKHCNRFVYEDQFKIFLNSKLPMPDCVCCQDNNVETLYANNITCNHFLCLRCINKFKTVYCRVCECKRILKDK